MSFELQKPHRNCPVCSSVPLSLRICPVWLSCPVAVPARANERTPSGMNGACMKLAVVAENQTLGGGLHCWEVWMLIWIPLFSIYFSGWEIWWGWHLLVKKNVHFYQEKNLNWESCPAFFFFFPIFLPLTLQGSFVHDLSEELSCLCFIKTLLPVLVSWGLLCDYSLVLEAWRWCQLAGCSGRTGPLCRLLDCSLDCEPRQPCCHCFRNVTKHFRSAEGRKGE